MICVAYSGIVVAVAPDTKTDIETVADVVAAADANVIFLVAAASSLATLYDRAILYCGPVTDEFGPVE